jgi:hypothetical protein
VIGTRLGRSFDRADEWRHAIAWLVRWSDELDLARVPSIVDYLHARQPGMSLRGCSLISIWRAAEAWHAPRGRNPLRRLSWPKSRWSDLVIGDSAARAGWRVVELLDSDELRHEGRSMHHCVAAHARSCARGASTIWSVRREEPDGQGSADGGQSRLTIEVDPRTGTIVQLRGPFNRTPSGRPLEIARAWAAREHLTFTAAVERQLDGNA